MNSFQVAVATTARQAWANGMVAVESNHLYDNTFVTESIVNVAISLRNFFNQFYAVVVCRVSIHRMNVAGRVTRASHALRSVLDNDRGALDSIRRWLAGFGRSVPRKIGFVEIVNDPFHC